MVYVCVTINLLTFFYLVQPGEKVMILPEVTDKDANKLFPKGVDSVPMPSGIKYIRTTTQYQ